MDLEKRRKAFLAKEVAQINFEEIKSFHELIDIFSKMSFQARALGICAKIWEKMLLDSERPTIFLGLAGALIAGGLRKLIADMIKLNFVDVIVSTGAILYQDLYQARGYKHYIGSPYVDDSELFSLNIDRIYDTFVDEEKFIETDLYISEFANNLEPRAYSSREFLELLAGKIKDENSILYNSKKYGVPIYCPCIADSSIGIGLAHYFKEKKEKEEDAIKIDPIKDNYEIANLVAKSKKTGAIYLGGGVPKNYINDAVVIADLLYGSRKGHEYAIQLTMDRPEHGGLSGSTLEEAKSWGKLARDVKKATAYVDITIGLPLIFAYLYERRELYKHRKRLKFNFSNL